MQKFFNLKIVQGIKRQHRPEAWKCCHFFGCFFNRVQFGLVRMVNSLNYHIGVINIYWWNQIDFNSILGFVGHGNPSLCRCGVQVDCRRQYLVVAHVTAVNNVWWLHGFVQCITASARHSVWLCNVLVSRCLLDAWVATCHPCVYIVGTKSKAFDCASHCLCLSVCLLIAFKAMNSPNHLLRLVVFHLFVVKRYKQQ